VILNTERTQTFIIKNLSCSHSKIKIFTAPVCPMVHWPIPNFKINPKTFQFTPKKNLCVSS